MARYLITVRMRGETTEHDIDAGSFPQAVKQAVLENGGGVVVDAEPLRDSPDIIPL